MAKYSNYNLATLNDIDFLEREILNESLFSDNKIINFLSDDLLKDYDKIKLFFKKDSSNIILIEGEYSAKIKQKIEDDSFQLLFQEDFIKDKRNVCKFISSRAIFHILNINKDTINAIYDLCGGNAAIIDQELIKLKIIFGEEEIFSDDVYKNCSYTKDELSLIDLYLDILNGNLEKSLLDVRELFKDGQHDSILSCLTKLLELSILINRCNNFENYISKKRNKINISGIKTSLVKYKDDVPSNFVIRVSKSICNRIGGFNSLRFLFKKCYNSFIDFRSLQNLSLAESCIEEMLVVMNRRI